ncbi:TcpD family membrane protein [Culicoidibacter larvae]|uniref:Uncharacterized protein n=1 Tax=Culicoidibacter larvae TaxID=2579976 RepID=A0A5R8QH25_9FIRM|nr:TcpD family membrane protein [Culicoidibacter larvae]TLG77341.1 hypothetical protein FEZ08_01610 [Culicoidibacter larvae]
MQMFDNLINNVRYVLSGLIGLYVAWHAFRDYRKKDYVGFVIGVAIGVFILLLLMWPEILNLFSEFGKALFQ